ncbi:hypothetical protein ACJJTC_001093 [Scirpophaga incertulas]
MIVRIEIATSHIECLTERFSLSYALALRLRRRHHLRFIAHVRETLPVATNTTAETALSHFHQAHCLPGAHKATQVDRASFAYVIVETKARSAYASPRYARPRFCSPG